MSTISGFENVKQYLHHMQCDETLKEEGHRDYDRFLKIIKISGEEIPGQVIGFNDFALGIRSPVVHLSPRKAQEKNSHWIPIKAIDSIIPLDISYGPKFICDWVDRIYSEDDVWLVEVIHCVELEKLVGQLLDVSGNRNGCMGETTLSMVTQPISGRIYIADIVYMKDIIAIRRLPYTSQSLLALKQEKTRLIKEATAMPDVQIFLVVEYLKVPDDLPESWYNYLITKANLSRNVPCKPPKEKTLKRKGLEDSPGRA